jgi:diadenosine tetraphosphate (Ap4A) HIT family hydrolase
MDSVCRFCDIKSGKTISLENLPILAGDNYFSLASIGALVNGWILIIPKEHTCSMKAIYAKEDFIGFVNQMLKRLWTHYNSSVIAFEHGPNKMNSETACGTDHAHLHLVPYSGSLLNAMFETKLCWEKCHASQIASAAGDNEYLFYSEFPVGSQWIDPVGYLHILKTPISQFFRKLIAQQLNCAEKYDYKKYSNIDGAIYTQQLLSSQIESDLA